MSHEMFVVLTRRVIKVNTGSTEKYAPRSANRISRQVSGPFPSLRVAQKAAFRCLGVHTCIDAQVWNEAQIREEFDKGYARNGNDMFEVLKEAVRMLDMGVTV
jgi:hypothetical protein